MFGFPANQPNPGPVLAQPAVRICRWDGGICNVPITDTSPNGIEHHIRTHHLDGTAGQLGGSWDRTDVMTCKWHVGTTPCARNIHCGSIGRHVASVHL
ncbi:hypothetical protein B0H21DRAFT_224838 [Amylocystis lapponica]|nr:hypothetical protein B0H21DRAFT_224838 [Amylocystis lapponica]